MSLIESFKKHPKYLILPLLCLFLAGYFTYHALTGQRGLLRYLELKKEIAKDTAIADISNQKGSAVPGRLKRT